MDLRSRSLVEFQSISTNEVHSSENFCESIFIELFDDGRYCAIIQNFDLLCYADKSFVNLRRKEFPIPWLEALFLPEFPSRSAIGEKNFIISNEIGNGTFGNVYRVIAKNNSRGIYALKIQQKSLIIGKHAVQQVRQEIAVQRLLPSHVFIARLYVSWQTRSKLFSVFQYPVGGIGDMFNLWQEHGVLPEQSVRIYGAELACALDFLHDHDVIYRDLKLENVALDSIGHIKMVDFGLAKVLKNGDQTNTVCGTLQYMSPDVASEKPYSHCVDWWSLAVLLHILVTGKYPYPNSSATHHRHLKFIDYSTPVNCSTEFGDLMNKMLVFPSRREIRTFNEFRNHIFFKSIDFDDVTDLKYNPLDEILNSSQRNDQSDAIDWDGEESIKVFGEDYEFDEFDYFNDAI
ncbi:kinase domain protein [Dictyocaulus viviparus]|uniref:Kinase domain protein n=1 Tax=Dictyocaulus viviparus TaxID=29172 RepID=A0A0D8Y3S2_DICVI|nr:kinase domain protein [Dictyocaulus viviparus]